jgi:CIC family chloride channel protein
MEERLSSGPVRQLRLRENQLFLALTIAVAVLAGLSAVLFSVAIDAASRIFFGLNPSSARLVLVPFLASIVSGFLLARVFPDVRGSGVPQTKAAFHLHAGSIPARIPLGKFIMGVLCVGSGHSMGREGPSVQIGAGIASIVARWTGLPSSRARELLPIGVAGALAAAFNTPIAAVLFALEEIIGDMNATLLGSTVVASVTAVIVERSILGNEPLFHVPPYHLEHVGELLAYAVLGVVGGLVSVGFSKGLLGARAGFLRLPLWTRPYQPALGGAIIGVLLLFVPQVMGVGYGYVDQVLNGGYEIRLLIVLCAAKTIATIVSYSSGNAGGIFAPSLYIGAMTGGTVGMLVQRYAPFASADAGAYALVGMGTLFAGIIRAPMTSVIMVFEITQDYQILVPLMLANLLSFWISRRYQPVPVYDALLRQDGVHLPSADAAEEVEVWTAADIMEGSPVRLQADLTVAAAAEALGRSDAIASVLVGHGRAPAFVMTDELWLALKDGRASSPIHHLARAAGVHVHPDQGFGIVIDRYRHSRGVLPVVSRENIADVVGLITEREITRFVSRPDPGARSRAGSYGSSD